MGEGRVIKCVYGYDTQSPCYCVVYTNITIQSLTQVINIIHVDFYQHSKKKIALHHLNFVSKAYILNARITSNEIKYEKWGAWLLCISERNQNVGHIDPENLWNSSLSWWIVSNGIPYK